jgi:23S rRNA (pseudouridine1915-N3)-methyltransferase
MKIHLITIGQRMPAWVADGYREYATRLPNNLLQLVELPLGQRGKSGDGRIATAQEGERMLKAIPAQARAIALDPRGRDLTTEQLASELEAWMQDGRDIALLVGGPDGLAPDCLARCEQRWSLSRLTFPHMLVRVVLAEQIYRAWTIVQHHPYHR